MTLFKIIITIIMIITMVIIIVITITIIIVIAIIIIIIIIIIINPCGPEVSGGNWHEIFSPLAVRLKCTQKIK